MYVSRKEWCGDYPRLSQAAPSFRNRAWPSIWLGPRSRSRSRPPADQPTTFPPRQAQPDLIAVRTRLYTRSSSVVHQLWLAGMQAYQDQVLPPSGVSHALSVRLTPSLDAPLPESTVISHLVTARNNQLQLWQVRERVGEDGEVSTGRRGRSLARAGANLKVVIDNRLPLHFNIFLRGLSMARLPPCHAFGPWRPRRMGLTGSWYRSLRLR